MNSTKFDDDEKNSTIENVKKLFLEKFNEKTNQRNDDDTMEKKDGGSWQFAASPGKKGKKKERHRGEL